MSEEFLVFKQNMQRATSIIKSAENLDTNGTKRSDVLRSAVVLLHSIFETYYRNVLLKKLPDADEKVLDSLKILDANNDKKVSLSRIRSYGMMSADEIVKKSIAMHLSGTSFNDYKDINNWAQKIHFDLSEFTNGKELNEMIHRRHKIVHEADMIVKPDGKTRLTPLGVTEVKLWFSVVENIVEIIDKQI